MGRGRVSPSISCLPSLVLSLNPDGYEIDGWGCGGVLKASIRTAGGDCAATSGFLTPETQKETMELLKEADARAQGAPWRWRQEVPK